MLTTHWLILGLLISLSAGTLVEFYNMIRTLAHTDPTKLLQYGCYCGYGNSGTNKVVDCLDMCCYHHDNCYAALKVPCPHEHSYYSFISYDYRTPSMECTEDQEECKYKLCKCDYDFGMCVKSFKRLYKDGCVGAKNQPVCSQDRNYTLPVCEEEELEEMINSTSNVCYNSERDSITLKSTERREITNASTAQTVTGQAISVVTSRQIVHQLDMIMTACLLSVLLAPVILP